MFHELDISQSKPRTQPNGMKDSNHLDQWAIDRHAVPEDVGSHDKAQPAVSSEVYTDMMQF